MVVDDTPASRYITSSWLRRNGHTVIEAETGAGALARLRETPVDLVVLDVRLPDMSGFEVCERIKQAPETAAIPVIHVSASFTGDDDRVQGLNRGADAYLAEPVDPNILMATVEAALRYYRGRMAAERLARRLNLLTNAGLVINGATSFDQLVEAATHAAASIFDSRAVVVVATSGQQARRGATAGPDMDVTAEAASSSMIDELSTSVLGDRVGADLVDLTPQPEWPDSDTLAVVVRTKPGQDPAYVALPTGAVPTHEERDLLRQLGQMTVIAAQGLRAFEEEHDLALTLQRGLLPDGLPQHAEVEMAARYRPAAANAEVGGDFFEVTELDDRLLFAIGDVTGHSIEAATIMGEVRHALRAYAVEGHGPAEITYRLDAMLRRFHPRGYTTLCLMVLDLASEELSVVNAGHIPPLIIDREQARYLHLPGPLLGIGVDRPAATRIPLPRGTTVLLATDGLIERRGSTLDADMEGLRQALRPDEDLEAMCDRLLRQFGQNKEDDIAMVAFRRR
nr:fused response regulator/phosphatase [Kibdelosporangium phytohabitans]